MPRSPRSEKAGSATPRPSSSSADRPAGPEWPSRILRPLARHLNQICVTAVMEPVGEAGLTMMEFNLLAFLGDSPGTDQNTMADWLGIDRTSVSVTVQAMEQKKLLRREVNEDDRRGWRLSLTRTGEALRKRVRPKSLAAQQRVLACLTTAEQEAFVDLLHRVVKANEDLALPGSGRRRPSRPDGKATG